MKINVFDYVSSFTYLKIHALGMIPLATPALQEPRVGVEGNSEIAIGPWQTPATKTPSLGSTRLLKKYVIDVYQPVKEILICHIQLKLSIKPEANYSLSFSVKNDAISIDKAYILPSLARSPICRYTRWGWLHSLPPHSRNPLRFAQSPGPKAIFTIY